MITSRRGFVGGVSAAALFTASRSASAQKKYDDGATDKDGVVTLAEFMAQAERNFARCDLNKDGRIDTAECRQALQRKPAER